MKKIRAALFFTFMLTLRGAAFSSDPMPVKMAFLPVHGQSAAPADVDLFNQAMNHLLYWLPQQEGFIWINQDSLIAHLDEPLQHDFADLYEPFSLLRLNQNIHVRGLLFCDLVKRRAGAQITVTLLEFPSGVLVARDSMVIRQQQVPPVHEIITPMLTRFSAADPVIGTPFSAQEQGMVILSGDLGDTLHFDQCQGFWGHLRAEESQRPLRLKIVSRHQAPSIEQSLCEQAVELIRRSNAAYVLELSLHDHQTLVEVWLPERENPKTPLEEAAFPVYPALEELRCVQGLADSNTAVMINAALMAMPERPADRIASSYWIEQPVLAFHAGFRLHEAAARAQHPIRPDILSQIQRLYNAVLSVRASKSLSAWTHLELGALFNGAGHYQEAEECLLRAETFFGPLPDKEGLILSRIELAKAYTALEEWTSARQSFDRLYHSPADSGLQAFAMQRIAALFEKENRADDAVHAYHVAARINQRIGRPYDAAMIYQRLGQLMREKNRLELSTAYLDTFLTQAQAMASEPALARAHFQSGLTRLARGERSTALNHFLKACDYMELLGDMNGVARADLNIGAIYWQMGDSLQARQRYLAALKQATLNGDSAIVLMSTVNLADIHLANGKWDQAQQFLDRALFIAESKNDTHERAKISYAKGLAYLKEGRLRDGYSQIKGAMALGGGTISGDIEKEQAFLRKLQSLIGDIETIRSTSPMRR